MNILHSIAPYYVVAGFVVGGLIGMTGLGGGSLMTPLLIVVFGVNPTTAVGTDLLFAACTKSVGTLAHSYARSIEWRIVKLLAVGSVPATAIGLVLLAMIDLKSDSAQRLVTGLLAAVLLMTSIVLFGTNPIRERYGNFFLSISDQTVSRLTVALGSIVGFLVTFTSVGAGALGVATLILLYPKMPSSRIVGSDIAHAVPLTLLAGSGHLMIGSLDPVLLVHLLVGSLPGVLAGTFMTRIAPERVLRGVLAVVLFGLGLKLML
jgi:uncharacterized membrane protein YfcA